MRIGPESCVGIREGEGEASAGEPTGQPLSHEITLTSGTEALAKAEGNPLGRETRVSRRPGVVGEPGVWVSSLRGNREMPCLAGRNLCWPLPGRRRALTPDVRTWKVRLHQGGDKAFESTSQWSKSAIRSILPVGRNDRG